MNRIILSATLLEIFTLIAQDTVASELAVHDEIFKTYQKNVRPVKNASAVTQVKIAHNSWNGFQKERHLQNAAQESFEFSMDYLQSWTDEFLTWDPSEFNGTETIRVPESLLWLPDICMTDSLNINPSLPEAKRRAKIDFDGTVSLYSPSVVTHYCKMEIDNFPYDTQTCLIWFAPWMYPTSQAMPIVDPPENDIYKDIVGNSEWAVLSFKAAQRISNSTDGEYIDLNFALTIKRNSVYYISVLIVPTFVITTLCLLGIFSPFNNKAEREEKVSLGLTTLLTIAVILNIVATEMPKASKLPLLGYFVLAELVLCTVAILFSIIIMFLHERALLRQWIPPLWLRKILLCKTKFRRSSRVQSFPFINSTDLKINAAFSELSFALKSVSEWIDEQKFKENLTDQWSEIFDTVDLFCLVFLQVFNVVMSATLML